MRGLMTRTADGFMMPTVVVMLGVSTVILLAIFQYVATTTNLTSQIIYRQIALTSARAAMDYGKEQFDADPNYPGTNETVMFQNTTYKVTYQLIRVSLDGRVMRVQGIGKIYLPATASAARYTRLINGEIIRSQITAEDPSDFSPLAWYDASCNDSTSNETVCNATNHVLTTTSTSATGNPTSLREERTSGQYCNGSPQTTSPSNNQLDITRGGECGASNQTYTGFMFNLGGNLPDGVTITNATIKLTANAVDSQSKTVRVRGIDQDNYANFTTNSSAQLGMSTTSANTDWAIAAWNSVGQSAGPQTSPNISAIIQEIIDRPGWNQGNNIGLRFENQSGSGNRRARVTGITLSVTYTGSGAANNGDSVQTWRDRSGNGFHMNSGGSSGAWATKSTVVVSPTTATPQGKPMISFKPSQSYMTTAVPSGFGSTADTYTTFALMRVKSGTATDGNATLVGFYGSGTGNIRYSPLRRATNGTDICIARGSTNRLCNSYGSSIPGTPSWTLWGARETLTETDMLMRRNGRNPTTGQSQFYDPITLNSPFNIVLGANATNNTPNSEVEFAEIIIYDTALSCPQVESIELYLAQKWGFTDTLLSTGDRYISDGCAQNEIPVY